jgi:ABC-type nickel/cobalt efflux system permease component RcnA
VQENGIALTEWLSLSTAIMLGAIHALEVDHMIAVTSFLTDRPGFRAAARFGARWGLGHAIAVLVFGGILLLSGIRWPERYDGFGELLVGILLVGIGVWAIVRARKLHFHRPEEHGDHLHLHAHSAGRHPHHHAHTAAAGGAKPHHHGRTLVFVGLMHGLAGSSSVVALVPVTVIDRTGVGLAYLAAFGIGVIVAMIGFALAATAAFTHAASRSVEISRHAGVLVGVLGILVGLWWLVRAIGVLTA